MKIECTLTEFMELQTALALPPRVMMEPVPVQPDPVPNQIAADSIEGLCNMLEHMVACDTARLKKDRTLSPESLERYLHLIKLEREHAKKLRGTI